MKIASRKTRPKTLEDLKNLVVKKKTARKKVLLSADSFFSSPPVDLGRTNNAVIDRILYGKSGA